MSRRFEIVSCYVMNNLRIAMRCQELFTNPRPTFSKGNANPHKMPAWPFLCLACPPPQVSIKCRCTSPTQKGPPGSGRHGQRRAILSGFALPFEMLVMGYFFQLFSNVLEGVSLCHNVMLCHEQLQDCYGVSRTVHKS